MLPKTIDPIRIAKQGRQFQGEFALNQCARLQTISDQLDQKASVVLELNVDHEAQIPFIRGSIHASLNMICQRCNDAMHYPLNITFLLSPVLSEVQAENLPHKYEPLIVRDETVALADLIEDEILLALPMVTKHERCATQIATIPRQVLP